MSTQSLCILGRQPALGLAELERLYGASNVQPVGKQAVLLKITPEQINFDRLGGSIKLCKIVESFQTTDWEEVQKLLVSIVPELLQQSPKSKLQLGLSAFGMSLSTQQLTAAAFSIKKTLKAAGRNVRIVPNQGQALNSAQVIHNRLTSPNGCELVLVQAGDVTICARTLQEQNITDYTIRDRSRPKRDARVGMLPPKLAQIIINLANPEPGSTILDPFCGTGVLLQEALLMGYGVYGSDVDPRMISYSQTNLEWLAAQYKLSADHIFLKQADATTFQNHDTIDAVASETYLGRPFTAQPSQELLTQTMSECNLILKKFLTNVRNQLRPGTALSLAIPAWQFRAGEFKHLPLVDQIEDLSYNRVSFVHVQSQDLLYYREDQIVARELLVITRK
jgi:tRNA G10  N-methylase Trm11